MVILCATMGREEALEALRTLRGLEGVAFAPSVRALIAPGVDSDVVLIVAGLEAALSELLEALKLCFRTAKFAFASYDPVEVKSRPRSLLSRAGVRQQVTRGGDDALMNGAQPARASIRLDRSWDDALMQPVGRVAADQGWSILDADYPPTWSLRPRHVSPEASASVTRVRAPGAALFGR